MAMHEWRARRGCAQARCPVALQHPPSRWRADCGRISLSPYSCVSLLMKAKGKALRRRRRGRARHQSPCADRRGAARRANVRRTTPRGVAPVRGLKVAASRRIAKGEHGACCALPGRANTLCPDSCRCLQGAAGARMMPPNGMKLITGWEKRCAASQLHRSLEQRVCGQLDTEPQP